MEATRRRTWAACACALGLSGCALFGPAQNPGARDPDPEPVEPPQVVTNDGTTTDDNSELLSPVERYVNRIEKAVASRPPLRAEASSVHAVDLAPPAESPEVGPPGVEAESVSPMALEPAEQVPPPPTKPLEPPTLMNAQVRASGQTDAAAPTDVPPTPNRSSTARPPTLREFLERRGNEGVASFADQLDDRVLWVVAGDYARAREPLNLVTAEQQAIASRFVEAQIVLRDAHAGDLGTAATAAMHELTGLQSALRELSDLSIPQVRVCSAVRGYGQYDAIDPPRFPAGSANEFVLYCEVRDFVSEKRSDGLFYTIFNLRTAIINRAGETVLSLKDDAIADRCRNERQDCFIPRLVRLPASLAPGSYVAKVTVEDTLGRKVAEARTTFELVARP